MENAERCVCCGEIIPEGLMVCPRCENGRGRNMATEKRLIDANALSNSISGIGKDTKRPRAVELACLCLIADAPTVDAVEVVRCKDCKYAMDMMPIENSGGCLMGECTLRKEDDIVFTAWGDEFCSYGERKDNG